MRAAGLNTGHMAELVGEALARDGCLLVRARGCSMHPTIRHGETIVVQPVQSPRVKAGMVVLFC
jgi:phage repressor protein C with HTH and peptisase S24 domain